MHGPVTEAVYVTGPCRFEHPTDWVYVTGSVPQDGSALNGRIVGTLIP